MIDDRRLPITYALLIFAYAYALFGFSMVAGKPLSIHEARLPQLAREMLHGGPVVLPQSGDRPWLERPPLPIWTVAAFGYVGGGLDDGQASAWATRLPSALAGAIACVLTAFSASRFRGKIIGLLAGLLLASSYEFYVYAGQAEDDIYLAAMLAACVACMAVVHSQDTLPPQETSVSAESEPPSKSEPRWAWLYNARPRAVWLFFVLAGLLHWIKGPMIGWMQLGGIVLTVMIFERQRRAWRTWLWLPGIAITLIIGLSWHVYAAIKFPSYIDNVLFDFTDFGAKPFYHYAVQLLWTAAPWTPFALLALVLTAKDFWRGKPGAVLPWAWGVAVVLILSVPSRKHHHYLLPALCGWAWLSAIGLHAAWHGLMAFKARRGIARGSVMGGVTLALLLSNMAVAAALIGVFGFLPGELMLWLVIAVLLFGAGFLLATGSREDNPVRLLSGWLLLFFTVASGFQTIHYSHHPKRLADVIFAEKADKLVPDDAPLMIDSGPELGFFLIQFHTRSSARLLQNVTYLLDERITEPAVYVIAAATQQAALERYGTVQSQLVSDGAYGIRDPDDRWTLFKLTFRPDLQRGAVPPVDVLQAMKRGEGVRDGPFIRSR